LLALGVGTGETMFVLIETSCKANGLKVVVDRLISLSDGRVYMALPPWAPYRAYEWATELPLALESFWRCPKLRL
jgi:hypothetical protein